jgi:hypothetical protein
MPRTIEINFKIQNGSQKIAQEKTSLTGFADLTYEYTYCIVLYTNQLCPFMGIQIS